MNSHVKFFGWDFRDSLPVHDNDNWLLMSEGVTPAEFMQWIKRTRSKMRRELEANFSLRADPTHREIWVSLDAMERCARWHFYGER